MNTPNALFANKVDCGKRSPGIQRALEFLALLLAIAACTTPARGQVNVTGQWQTLPTQAPINPIHIALMHNGKVLIAAGSGNLPSDLNYEAAVWDPATDTITTQPVDFDMFCNGMIVLEDGRPFVMSGTQQYDPFHGTPKTSAYDPATGMFVDMQPMAHGRWYPTATTLSDGSLMIFSGLDENGNTNTTVEIYKLGVGWSAPYQAQWTPPLYPRQHLLPNGNVFYSGSTTSSAIFNTASHTWTTGVANTIYSGTRTYGSSVLLPLTPANNYKPVVMILGGGSPATPTTELIDLSVGNPKWVSGPNMSEARIEMDATILPSGKVLAVNGSVNDEDATTASLNADLYDPIANKFSSAGTATYPRLYHSGSILLPDATVLVLGGNPQRGTYEPYLEIYSPAYLFNSSGGAATRPTITSVTPGVLGYGSSFQIQTPDAANISSAVLMRAGAVTHAFDMEQRLVGLSFTVGNGVLNTTAPPNGSIAPPGYYMLFILNSSGVPSLAKFVQLSNAPNDQPPNGSITSPTTNVTIAAGQSVSFAGTGTSPDGTITAYSWVFPGGNPGTSSLATPGPVTFPNSGTFTASLTVTDSNGLTDPSPETRTITASSDFTFAVTPASQTVSGAGGGTTYTATVTAATGFDGTVSFVASGLPSGGSASFNPATVTGSGSTTMTVTTSTSTPPGTYQVTVTASSGSLVHSANVTLVITSASANTIQYVQSNYSDPQASQSPVSIPFTSAQTGGDLNVVVAGWFDSTTQISSVSDSMGNAYIRAVGPTVVSGYESQAIYYAKNIAAAPANGNTVTVTFNAQASYPDIRILEYSGADPTSPLDVIAASSGTNSPTNSGAATTTNANDLIFGASVVWTSNTGPGNGFTMRILTQPNHDIAEDEMVMATGSYSATAPLNSSGPWIMQMTAFKAAGASTPPVTTPPTTPTNLAATVISSSQINLTWTASTDSVSTVSGYFVQRCVGGACTTSDANFVQISSTSLTSYSDTTVVGSTQYTYRVQATDPYGNLSGFSNLAGGATPTPDFSLSASPTSQTLSPGGNTNYTVTVTPNTGFNGTVSFTTSGLPTGASATFSPSTITTSGATTMTVSTTTSTSPGSYPFTVTGTSGSLGHSANLTLVVNSNSVVTIQYVQSDYADPQSSQSPVKVPFTAAQVAGDLNVVVIGWFDSTTQITSVTDTMGNTYTPAVGPTVVSGYESQAIYYAKNIAAAPANGNTVTVTFNAQASYPDIRILEYSGADPTGPLDVVAASSGTNSPTNSGAATTTNANDLIFGASVVWTSNTGPGNGFTMRILTQPNHDIAEDEMVMATGSYSATAPLNSSGPWIMQMVAFKAHH